MVELVLWIVMAAGAICAVIGPVLLIWGLVAPHGWFAGEQIPADEVPSRRRAMVADFVRQVLITIVTIEVWRMVRGK